VNAVPNQPCNLMQLRRTSCRFPTAPGFYCGVEQQDNSSYCPKHHVLCHVPRAQAEPAKRKVSRFVLLGL
jgi:hypothetical protein